MTSTQGKVKLGWIEWFKMVGVVAGAILAVNAVIGLFGGALMYPVHREIVASADTLVRRMTAADDSLRVEIRAVKELDSEVLSEIRDIHTLLLKRR